MTHRREFLGGAGAVLAGTMLGSGRAQGADPRNLAAFVLGIDKYVSLRPLERAVNDARSIAAKIEEFGYRTVLLEDPGADALLGGLNRFLAMLSPETSAFVFAACHGIQVGGQNFILPADADGSAAEKLLESALQAGELLSAIARRRPQQCIAMFDACRNDPIDVTVPGLATGFASINAPGGFYVAYSAGEGQFALDSLGEGDTGRNGVFARYLVEQLEPDTLIDDTVKNVREEVIAAAQQVGHNQCPSIYDQAGRDLRLDGQRVPARRRVKANPRLDGAGVLIVALQDYYRYSPLARLRTPYSDAQRLARDFERLGASVTTLLETNREELLATCREMGSKGFSRLLVYLAGHGGMQDRDAWLLVPGVPRAQWSAETEYIHRTRDVGQMAEPEDPVIGRAAFISVSEIVSALAPPEDSKAAVGGAKQRGLAITLGKGQSKFVSLPRVRGYPANAHVFCDLSLTLLGLTPERMAKELGPSSSPRSSLLAQLQYSTFDYAWYPGISLLFASSPDQEALDAAPDRSSSPFALAIANALGQPGLTVAQFADRVRSQVEAMTDRFQTPMLYCDKETQNQVLIDAV